MNHTNNAALDAPASKEALSLRPKGEVVLQFGTLTGNIMGGPFHGARYWAGKRLRIKLAKEINAPCDVNLPIPDFSVPTREGAREALSVALHAFGVGNGVFAGCMAGQGRTGLFIALLTKLAMDYEVHSGAVAALDPHIRQESQFDEPDPVLWVRKHYYSHAVETSDQAEFVRGFDTASLLVLLDGLQKRVPVAAPVADAVAPVGWLSRLWGAVVRFLNRPRD